MQGAALTHWRLGKLGLGKLLGPGRLRGLVELRPFGVLRRACGLRRVGGVVITLGVVASVAVVGEAASGWLADPPPGQLAAQAADGEARLLALALRQLPPDGLPDEARFAETATAVPSELLRVDVRRPGDAVLTVQLVGQASSGAFDGRSAATVVRCYAMDWQPAKAGGPSGGSGGSGGSAGSGGPAGGPVSGLAADVVGDPVPTACPALPVVPAGAPSGSELAAELNAGSTGERASRAGVFATGQPGACAFAETRPSGRLLAWAAPLLAPCTNAAAREAAAFGA
ncbi:hypothetical protein [Streptacidiphilus fuscans]|uniref:Uncharacterized protein n=1 Tax=Streptacidiphilus fuscans TaxID=2789292 RepID=A0A931B731_9ACTN|nr:hypothetical protein [Streptacidiphilus fuscans]MBF9070201.1 hypothetical protein [Streptacidiphilus fuscans]